MKRILIGLLISAGILIQPETLACTMVRTAGSGVDPGRYVFYGTVTGYGSVVSAHCKDPSSVEDHCRPIKTLVVTPDHVLHAPSQIAGDVEVVNTFVGDELCGIPFDAHDSLMDYSQGMRLKISAPAVSDWYRPPPDGSVVLDGGFQGDIAALYTDIDDDLNQEKLCKGIEEVDANGAYGAESSFEEQKLYLLLEGESSIKRRYELIKGFIGCAGNLNFFRNRRGKLEYSMEWPGDLVSKYLQNSTLQRKLKADLYIHYYFSERLQDEEVESFLKERAMQGDRRFQYEYALSFKRNDQEQSLNWLKKSAAQQYLPAMFSLASFYRESVSHRQQSDRDIAILQRADSLWNKALGLAQKGAEKDEPVALSILAAMYSAESGSNPDKAAIASSYLCRLSKWMGNVDDWIYNSSDFNARLVFDVRSVANWCDQR